MTREKEEAIEHALAELNSTTNEIYMKARYTSRERLEKLLFDARELSKSWAELITELETELNAS